MRPRSLRVLGPATYLMLLSLPSLPSCTPDLQPPEDASIACASSAECPSGWTCRDSMGRCVKSSAKDDRPPGLRGLPQIAPETAGAGQVCTVRFDVDEPLAIEPALLIADDPARPFSLVGRSSDGSGGESYVFEHTVDSSDPEGEVDLVAHLIDRFGSSSTPRVGSLRVDFTPPELAELGWVLPADKEAARTGDVLSVTASTSTDARLIGARLLAQDGSVLLDVGTALHIVTTGSSASLAGEVDLGAVDLGPVTGIQIEVDLEDAVQNRVPASASRTPLLPVDLVPPSGGDLGLNGGDPQADGIAIEVHAHAEGARSLWLADGGTGFPDLLDDGNTFEWRPMADADASFTVYLTPIVGTKTLCVKFRDGAYNETAPVCRQVELVPDWVPPQITSFVLTSASPTRLTEVGATMTVSDNIGVVAYALSTSASRPALNLFERLPAPTLGETTIDVHGTIPAADGTYTLYAWVADSSGNWTAAGNTISVVYDSQPPTIDSFEVASGNATNNPQVGITITMSDSGGGPFTCLVRDTGTSPAAADVSANCAALTWTLPTADGPYTLYGWVKDKAGNVSAMATGSVLLDLTPPVVTAFTAARAHYDGVLPITSFSATDPGGANASGVTSWAAQVGGSACTTGAPGGGYQATPPTSVAVASTGMLQNLYGCVKDAAGNVGSAILAGVANGEIAWSGPGFSGAGGTDIVRSTDGNSFIVAAHLDPLGSSQIALWLPPAFNLFSVPEYLTDYRHGPRLAVTADRAMVIYATGSQLDIIAQRFERMGGGPMGEETCPGSIGGRNDFDPDAAVDSAGRVFVAWTWGETCAYCPQDISVTTLPATGSPTILGSPDPQEDGTNHNFSPALDCRDSCVVAWAYGPTTASETGVAARLLAPSLLQYAGPPLVVVPSGGPVQEPPRVAVLGSTAAVVAWVENDAVVAQRLTITPPPSGGAGLTTLGSRIPVSGSTYGISHVDVAAGPDGTFTLVWEASDTGYRRIMGRTFGSSGNAQTDVQVLSNGVAGDMGHPSVVRTATEAWAAWAGANQLFARGF